MILAIVANFIRAAKTNRYEQALIYLEKRNNNTFLNTTYENCKYSGLFKDEIYCEIEGKFLKKPGENVGYQSVFKNWTKIELTINILRAIITGIFLLLLFFVKNKIEEYIQITSNKNANIDEEKEKYNKLWIILIIGLIILIFDSSLCILIRALSISANINIGLYEDGTQNQFEEYIAINYIIDIIIIVLHGISICFVQRIKQGIKQYTPPVIVQNKPRSQNIQIGIIEQHVRIAGIVSSNEHPIDDISDQ